MANSNIAVIIPSLNVGGAERLAIVISNELARRGMNVLLINISGRISIPDEIDDGVDHISLGCQNVRNSFFSLRHLLKKYPGIPTISIMTHTNLLVALVHRSIMRNRSKNVYMEVGHNATRVVANPFRNLAFKLLLKAIYPHLNEIVCVSESIALELSGHVKGVRTTVINNPVDLEFIRTEAEMEIGEISKRWIEIGPRVKAQGHIRLCAVGRLELIKGFDAILKACHFLDNQGVNYTLDIVGDGQQMANLLNLRSKLALDPNRVRLHGYSSNPWKVIGNSDITVISSLAEGSSLVAVESLALGTRVVARDVGGLREVLSDGAIGTLFNGSDPSVIAHAILAEVDLDRNYEMVIDHLNSFDHKHVCDLLVSKLTVV